MHSSTLFVSLAVLNTSVSAGCYKHGDGGNHATANNNIDLYFEVKRTGDNPNLNATTCRTGLLNEVNGCANGGSSDFEGWYYRSDPNKGQCKDIDYINNYPNGRRVRSAPDPNRNGKSKREVGFRV
ncbi:hypothetical protein BU23DRAFT_596152 [Bimuria novae-zelandiae CBS 107.79]|uniref:Uncharacterized protein n=1 Tax=Bimuria novae-zelandiae CBS 107.79 TaxID=1447943 RepID=A0A6A5VLU1_9PLEO|nr:hypothetical protein BU23DRAFT_596152 [Bimuria novae-zelandiae CBS 107.79]